MRMEALIIHSGGRIRFLIHILDQAPSPRRTADNYTASRSHGRWDATAACPAPLVGTLVGQKRRLTCPNIVFTGSSRNRSMKPEGPGTHTHTHTSPTKETQHQ